MNPYLYSPGAQSPVPDDDVDPSRRKSLASCSSSVDACCSSFYTAADATSFLVGCSSTLTGLVDALASGMPQQQAAAARTLSILCVDHINCWYTLKAGVVPQLSSLLTSPHLCEETAYHAVRVGSALAKNCPGAELARAQLPHALVMFLRYSMQQAAAVQQAARSRDGDSNASSDDDDDEGPPRSVLLSTRVALHLASALADLAFEQIGKRMIVQAGGVSPLLSIARRCPSVDCRTAALLALKRLAADEPCAQVMLKGGAREEVDAIVRTGMSPECKDCALSLLSSLEKQSTLSEASEASVQTS